MLLLICYDLCKREECTEKVARRAVCPRTCTWHEPTATSGAFVEGAVPAKVGLAAEHRATRAAGRLAAAPTAAAPRVARELRPDARDCEAEVVVGRGASRRSRTEAHALRANVGVEAREEGIVSRADDECGDIELRGELHDGDVRRSKSANNSGTVSEKDSHKL